MEDSVNVKVVRTCRDLTSGLVVWCWPGDMTETLYLTQK